MEDAEIQTELVDLRSREKELNRLMQLLQVPFHLPKLRTALILCTVATSRGLAIKGRGT